LLLLLLPSQVAQQYPEWAIRSMTLLEAGARWAVVRISLFCLLLLLPLLPLLLLLLPPPACKVGGGVHFLILDSFMPTRCKTSGCLTSVPVSL
jgi:hypothetical protein